MRCRRFKFICYSEVAMRSWLKRDIYARKRVQKLEKKYKILKFIASSNFFKASIRMLAQLNLSELLINNTQFRNRCVVSNRGKFVFKKYKISRLVAKKYFLDVLGYYPSS